MPEHRIATKEEWQAERRELLNARRSTCGAGTSWRASVRSCHGSRSTRSTSLRRTTGRSHWPSFSTGARSCSSTTSLQLLVYHFMFGFGLRVDEQNPGCTGCSFVADHFDGAAPHLNGHDVALVAESIAPLEELHPYKERMGWRFPWVSSLDSDFKYDFGAAFTEEEQRSGAEYNYRHVDQVPPQREGMSAFALSDGVVYHTYSTYDRGVEQLMGTYPMLDLAPLGRNEEGPASWWHRHDEYDPRPKEAG